MRHGDDPGARADQLFKLVQHQFAAIVDGRDPQARALFFAKNLPRHNVRVVLHGRDQHLVARADVRASIGLRHQVDGLRRPAHKDNLARIGGVHEPPHRLPRGVVRLGSAHAQRVHPAMNVGVQMFVVMRDGVENHARLLRSGRVVEIDEGLAVHKLGEDWEVGANLREIEARGDG